MDYIASNNILHACLSICKVLPSFYPVSIYKWVLTCFNSPTKNLLSASWAPTSCFDTSSGPSSIFEATQARRSQAAIQAIQVQVAAAIGVPWAAAVNCLRFEQVSSEIWSDEKKMMVMIMIFMMVMMRCCHLSSHRSLRHWTPVHVALHVPHRELDHIIIGPYWTYYSISSYVLMKFGSKTFGIFMLIWWGQS